MGSLAIGKLRAMLDASVRTAADHPALFSIYLALLGGAVAAALVLIWRRQPQRALWCAAAMIAVDLLFYTGDDSSTHAYRIAALAGQLRGGTLDPLLVDPTSGDAVPTFVYYSPLPYILPVLLDLAGVPALYALKLAMICSLAVLVAGLQVLLRRLPSADAPNRSSRFVAAILFVAANYVGALWFARAALGEIWVCSLMPWVVASSLSPRSRRGLALCLFLQICGHPVVLAQALLTEVVVAWAVSGTAPATMVRRWLAPAVAAVVLAAPFWLPQALAQSVILGPRALPSTFAQSFFGAAELALPQSLRTVGVWLPLAALLLVAASRARLPWQFWIPAVLAAGLMALQTKPLLSVTGRLPMLELSLFVWRLALPVAFLLFGALVAAAHLAAKAERPLAVLASLAVASLAFVMLQFPPNLPDGLASGWADDRRLLVELGRSDIVWGTREYLPNYAGLPRACDGEALPVSYRELRDGVTATTPFVRVRHGPVGLVDYRANGERLAPAACDDALVLGPLPPAARITVSESRLHGLTLGRGVGLVVALVLILWAIPFSALARRDEAQ